MKKAFAFLGFIFPVIYFPIFLTSIIIARASFWLYRRNSIDYHRRVRNNAVEFFPPYDLKGKKIKFGYYPNFNSAHWELNFDGSSEEGREIQIDYWIFFMQVHISFHNFFPKSWYPKYKDSSRDLKPWGESTYGFYIHHWNLWLHWDYDGSGWRHNKGCINFDLVRALKGKDNFNRVLKNFRTYVMNFPEGPHPLIIIKEEQRREYQRWWTDHHTAFHLIPGYWVPYRGDLMDSEFGLIRSTHENGHYYEDLGNYYRVIKTDDISKVLITHVIQCHPIPIPGKGTESYNMEDTATYSAYDGRSSSFEDAYGRLIGDIMKTRITYGGPSWVPAN